MGIATASNIVNIYQTVLSNQFTNKIFTVTNPNVKDYDLVDAIVPDTDVVLLNGLYQIKGPDESYTISGSIISFNSTTILTPTDEISVYYEKQL